MTVSMTVLTVLAYILPQPRHRGINLRYTESVPTATATEESVTAPSVEEDLDYYLDRHNVEDEGYEMVVAFANGRRHHVEIDYRLSPRDIGRWKGYHREGTVLFLDSMGRTVIGTCRNDMLETGIRPDSEGTYFGEFLDDKAHGHGAYIRPGGSYFEGHWEKDRRNGFGLEQIFPEDEAPRLRVGVWSNDRYQGERMRHTTERIYGIDIARYQHGKGRFPVPIQWGKLRITHIGKRGSQNVKGTVDYPVSFIYIKSTEGISVRNRFYPSDYAQARKHGIRVGAYHFWSVRTDGTAQAEFFLKNTHFNKGDLPPVLDIEPTKAQIEQMGGAEKMFRHIRAWLRIVERKVGVKPILYVNQAFIDNYLAKEKDLKRDYAVWIARYSEYKPDLRLTYWQLCQDGRVSGIQGDVDVNVFNGYKSQYEAYLEEETVR